MSPTYTNNELINGINTCFWPSYDPDFAYKEYPEDEWGNPFDPNYDPNDNIYALSWRPAEALNYGKYHVLERMGNNVPTEGEFYMYHYFGDPEMMLRTETPQAISASHISAAVPDTPTDMTVTVTKDGNSLEGALVAITHPSIDDDYWTGYTDANGLVTFSDIVFHKDDSNDPNHYDIVATAHNCIPYEGMIFLYESRFCIKDSSDHPVAWFDNFGNLFLKGTLEPSTTPDANDSIDEFRFQDSNGIDLAIIDATNGNMYITGSLYENQAELNPQGDNNFIIKDSNDDTLAYIDDPNGDLYLKGKLFDDLNP